MLRQGGTAILLLGAVLAVTPMPAAARSHAPTPKAGSRVVAAKAKGKVTVKAKGAHKFRKLKGPVALKLGATIDATKGTVKVTGLIGKRKITARLSGAAFKLTQSSRKASLVATLTGGGITCTG